MLVKQGVALNDSGKYADAISKYEEAIKADPTFENAYYEKGYTLFTSGRETEAIPVLKKLLELNPKYAGAYDMLGSIYDDQKDADKAVTYYKKGIEADSSYQRLHFNLAITLYRLGKFAEAEESAIKAIKLDPKHASSQRVYALAVGKEGKRGVALLAWCSFLMLEPQSKRTAEGYNYVHNLLNYGITQTSPKHVTLSINTKDVESPDFIMQMTVVTAVSGKKDLTGPDSLALQLKNVFEISGTFYGKKANAFYKSFFSDYFKVLANTTDMPAYARLISLTAYKDENLKWFRENESQLQNLINWTTNTRRDL